MSYLFTSESVSEGHPDKLCDQVSDAILDAYLNVDPKARVACECLVTSGRFVIAGEVKSIVKLPHVDIAKSVIADIGYDNERKGFDYRHASFIDMTQEQSAEIGQSVADGGAGDQGLMFGYAINETPELMPAPIWLAHRMMQQHSILRQELKWIFPDAKSQVTVSYRNKRPEAVTDVVLSTQHLAGANLRMIMNTVSQSIVLPVISELLPDSKPNILINPSGSFIVGGPKADTGLTGRKIIVDTYGGSCPHGGGAFSGKDPSKVDRSGAYAARWVAKHIVAAGLADRCTVQLSYAIGVSEPTSLYVTTHRTGRTNDSRITELVKDIFDLTPRGIMKDLDLLKPIYRQTAAFGHFGKPNLPWEILNDEKLERLKSLS